MTASAGQLSSRMERVRADQIHMLYRRATPGVIAAMLATFVVCWFLDRTTAIAKSTLWIWMAVMVVQSMARLGLFQAYRRLPVKDWRPWALAFCCGAVAGGITWGVGGLWLMDPGHFDHQLLVIVVILALVFAALSSFGSYLPAFYCFLFPSLVPLAVWSALQGDVEHWTYALLSLLWIPAVAIIARSFNRNVVDSLDLHYRNLDLLEDVRLEKQRAEEANIAKSRFLAAASHDLRQPVHALGMFIGALRERQMDGEARRLVDQIEGSAAALDDLFTALLDVSRLDAGVVQPKPTSFAVQPLLERVCRDFAAEAAHKGVRLTLRPTPLIVHSEPILLERIVRNLVANAVRYTRHGRVLVACRRRGETVDVEVWDTGVGIPPDQQSRVFEEFYQLHNPERDRSHGLGLGLAIVKRLSTLLDHPVTLRSEPGKGSVFRVGVPRADAAAPLPPAFSTPLPRTGLIAVIDDELAVREAMKSLLSCWGHDVVVAGTLEEMLDQLNARPDIIVCDYRLRNSANGIDAIRHLQAKFGADIPGVLITGDTAPDRLREAQASGFLLLHKPVANGRLRATIGNLLRAADA